MIEDQCVKKLKYQCGILISLLLVNVKLLVRLVYTIGRHEME